MKVGDSVKMWSSVRDLKNKRKLGKAVWTVTRVEKDAPSQSGVVLDVEIEECSHCGAKKRKMVGYDSDWFVVISK